MFVFESFGKFFGLFFAELGKPAGQVSCQDAFDVFDGLPCRVMMSFMAESKLVNYKKVKKKG